MEPRTQKEIERDIVQRMLDCIATVSKEDVEMVKRAMKKRTDPVYNKDIRKTGKPKTYANIPHGWKMKEEEYHKKMKARCINPDDKHVTEEGDDRYNIDLSWMENPENLKVRVSGACCDSPEKYKNVISNNLKFWACRNCGADLGDC